MALSRHNGRGLLRGAHLHSIATPHEDSPPLSYHQQLYPYMYKDKPAPLARGELGAHVAAWMAANGPATVEDIARGAGVNHRSLLAYLTLGKVPGAVRVGVRKNDGWRPRRLWGVTRG